MSEKISNIESLVSFLFTFSGWVSLDPKPTNFNIITYNYINILFHIYIINGISINMDLVIGNIKIKDVNVRNFDNRGWFFILDKDNLSSLSQDDSNLLKQCIRYGTQVRFVNEIGFSQTKQIYDIALDDTSIKCYYR